MKKFLCLIFLFALVGCTQKADLTPVTRNISFTAEMTYYNEYYEIAVDINKNGDITAAMIHPTELKGLIFTVQGGQTTAEFDGIKISADGFKTAAIDFIYSAFKSDSPQVYKNENRLFIKGDCDGGQFTMYLSGSGLPLKIEDSADRFEIIIKNIKINN